MDNIEQITENTQINEKLTRKETIKLKRQANMAKAREARKIIRSPRTFLNQNGRNPSVIAKRFKLFGLDWMQDFAEAIKANKKERIKLWLKLLPYMITTHKKTKVKKWKQGASKAALIALEAMEQE